jgi:ATP-dependent DNA helicase RecG
MVARERQKYPFATCAVGPLGLAVEGQLFPTVRAVARACEPAVEMKVNVHEVGDKRVVIIEVSPGKNKPYLVRGKGPYIRVGSSDRIATRAELDQLYGRWQLT